jgi:ubiquinone biosynthesis UbiH/UbiF/VisC/COQ6 family hydroxylase
MRNPGLDICIVGGGPVGASFALSLARTCLALSLVESKAPAQPGPQQQWDTRIYAISPQNQRFLQSLLVWPALDASRISPVRRMLVFGDAGKRLEFSAYDTGVSELAWIVEAGALTRAMWARLEQQENLELICPSTPRGLDIGAGSTRLGLESGRDIDALLVVGADGANSFVRREAGFKCERRPYGQLGVVANFQCGRSHRETAFQWFRSDGVLAWLPLPGGRMSMVWSTSEEHGRELLSLSQQQLCRRVADAGGGMLGELDLLAPAAGFPIALLGVQSMTAARIALIGDAAHVVHPLAGQGVNLGMADAARLSQVLATRPVHADVGDPILLRQFERARGEDILAMRWTTDGLLKLFQSPDAALIRMRNWGLNSVNHMPVLKNLLIRHALG